MATYRDTLRRAAIEHDGYVTAAIAKQHGVPAVELRKLASRGAFEKRQRGVYRDPYFPPTDEFDHLREALLTLGDGAYLTGETVLEVLGIGQLNPHHIHIASPKRHRRQLPSHWKIYPAKPGCRIMRYNGMPAQHVAEALKEVFPHVMPDRWVAMVDHATQEGFVRATKSKELKELQ